VIAGLGLLAAPGAEPHAVARSDRAWSTPGTPLRPGRGDTDRQLCAGPRRLVVGLGALAALISAALLPRLHFDFNPIRLRSSEVESVATLVDLMRDPDRSPNTLEVIRSNLTAADSLAAISGPTRTFTAHTLFLVSFLPATGKDHLIADAANLVDLTLNPLELRRHHRCGARRQSEPGSREAASSSIEDSSLRRTPADLPMSFDALARAANQREPMPRRCCSLVL